MRVPILVCVSALSFPACSDAQPGPASTTRYEISFENRAHHEAEIDVTFTDLGTAPLELRMSRTSPGRYALHEFAKNVYNFRATGSDGRAVDVSRPNNHQWDVSGHGGSVHVTYTLYGDRADGTYVGIDRTHGHLNMPATFMWARGLEDRPIQLTVRAPEGSNWRAATQLAPTDDPYRFTAPNLMYFLDSPTEVSDYWERSWDVDGKTVRIALHHGGTDQEAAQYAEAAGAIVDAAKEIYGELPEFDYGTYTFLACYLPWVNGDGMEHRNSTVLTSTASLASNLTGLLGTVAHEFFHVWNIERIRPATLEPFDFEAANMSRELWFGEGFTSYFDDLILWRAGLIPEAAFVSRMGGIANSVMNARGRRFFSPVEMSMQAPFVDAATSVDPSNRANTFLSYYTWGSGVALALDLTLRTTFDGLTLDHIMREMWMTHGVTEVPYDVADVEAVLARATGDDDFARDFFDRYVRGREAPEYARLLGAAGIDLDPARPSTAWIGQQAMTFGDGAATMLATPLVDSPLYDAGVDRGDRITSIDGVAMTGRGALVRALAVRRPGDTAEIRFESRGEVYEMTLILAEDPALASGLAREGGSEAQSAFRAAWKESSAR